MGTIVTSKMTDITAGELKEDQKDFDKYDQDGSGSLEKPEIFKALEELLGHEPDEEAFEDFMQEADTDQNGKIDFKEFMCVVLSDSEWTVDGQEYGAKKKKDQSEPEDEQEDDEAEHDDAYWEKKQLQDDEAFEAKERKRNEEEEEEKRKQEAADEAEERKEEDEAEANEAEAEADETKRKKDQAAGVQAVTASLEKHNAAEAQSDKKGQERLAEMLAASDLARPENETVWGYRSRREAVEADWDDEMDEMDSD